MSDGYAEPDVTSATTAVRRPTWSLAAPFGLVLGVGVIAAVLPPHDRINWWAVGTTLSLLTLALVLFAVSVRRDTRTWLDPMTAFVLFPAIAFGREALGGGATGLSALILVPLLWLAVTGSRHELTVAAVLAGLTFVVPALLRPEAYPDSDWRRAVTWMAIALILAPVVQRLVAVLERERRRALGVNAELDRANQDLVLATERTNRLFEDAPHGVAVVGPDGLVRRTNGALREITGAAASALDGRPFTSLGAPEDTVLSDLLDDHLLRGLESSTAEAVVRDRQGNHVPVSVSSRHLRHPDPSHDVILANIVDVSEQRRYEQRLAHLADHDVLTGLANRRLFEKELERHLDHCRRYGPTGAVLLLDLDNFKQVNDTLGHGAGDELIVDVAGLLRQGLRATDLVARLGGDEFAVLLPRGDLADAESVAQSLVARVREHAATLDGVRRRVTTSIGVATFKAAAEHSLDMLALADLTMYDAKEAGRDRYAVVEEGTHRVPRAGARLQWQNRIEEALRRDQFVLHFQPILDLATDRVSSAEALVRLADSDELVPPSRFLYIAERAGLAPELDAWVVRHAVAELARMRSIDPGFQLEVNLSGHSIGSPQIETTILDAITTHRIDPGALILEITETAAVSDVRQARAFAERMTAVGCKFALDDFGAGFGSFYYLKHLLFDYVKIDGEFVAHSPTSEVDRQIMRSIVQIARDLGKRTVAEFVGSAEVLDVVRSQRVDLAQGFFIGEPVPADEFIRTHLSGGAHG